MKILECPICGEKFKTLNGHILNKHNMTIEEFKKIYPNQQLHLDNRKREDFVCDICGKHFTLKNAMSVHKKYIHGIENKKEQKTEGKLECKICGILTSQISEHVRLKHRISFENYCKEYNYQGPKAIFSDSHKKNLSKYKKIFYDSERGYKQKKKQSELFSGQNNPSKLPETRKKISEKASLKAQKEKH